MGPPSLLLRMVLLHRNAAVHAEATTRTAPARVHSGPASSESTVPRYNCHDPNSAAQPRGRVRADIGVKTLRTLERVEAAHRCR